MSTSKENVQRTGGAIQMDPESNILIQDRSSTQLGVSGHNCYNAGPDGFKHLQAHVAPTAYTTQQEVEAPKCHPNTRMAILDTIMDWVLLTTARLQWILWINGAAGAGKSAIARSFIEMCLQQEIVIAQFFFLRTDPTRNTIKPLVATLAYQLIQFIPALDAIITPKIQSDPLIFQKSLETQFKVLIFEPLQQLHQESPLLKPIVFMVDGVDECSGHENQDNVIHTIAQFVAQKLVPLIVIFASRTEPQLKMAFDKPKVDGILQRLPLDTNYYTTDDIRLFLNDSFAKIKETHPSRTSIPLEWPTPSLVQEIVDKSSNQFIYASVVTKFLSSPSFHPVHQLEIVRELRPVGRLTPFAQVDALYQHILSGVYDITLVTAILAAYIFGGNLLIHNDLICDILDITSGDMVVALADLAQVISYNKDRIMFLHASLPDFLLDQSRAQQYFIDRGLWCEQLAIKCLNGKTYNLQLLNTYLGQAKCTSHLWDALYTFDPFRISLKSDIEIVNDLLDNVHKMDFGDGEMLYHHMLGVVVPYLHRHWSEGIQAFEEKHDIKRILDQIEHEKVVQEEIEQENTGQEEIVQENTGQEEIEQENTGQEEIVQEETVQTQSFKTLLRMKKSSQKCWLTRSRHQQIRGYDVGEEENQYMAPFKSCFAQFFNSWRK